MCISEEEKIAVRFGKAKAKKNVHLSRPNARRCRLVFQVEGREHGCCRCKPYNAGVTEEEFLGPGETFIVSGPVPVRDSEARLEPRTT